MGTKNNPGRYDCLAKAEDDEPVFVLLARDPQAPALVDLWARIRELLGEDPAKVAEARACAAQMHAYRLERNHRRMQGPDDTPASVRAARAKATASTATAAAGGQTDIVLAAIEQIARDLQADGHDPELHGTHPLDADMLAGAAADATAAGDSLDVTTLGDAAAGVTRTETKGKNDAAN